MKSFDVNTDILKVRFKCPLCDKRIDADLSDIIPYSYMRTKVTADAEDREEMVVRCSRCNRQFTIEVVSKSKEGYVSVYHGDKQTEIKEFQLFDSIYDEFHSPTCWRKDKFESDEDYWERMQDQEDWLESFDD